MKTVVISCVALLLVILIVIANSLLVSYHVEKIIERLEKTPNEISEAEAYNDIYDDYMKRQKYIGITVSHDDLTNIESEFCEILGAIQAKDDDTLIISKSRLIGALRHLKRLAGINADSIF
ncbi:MAG: DUF4363 family protein [Clostridia bacterium]|nr:DUF4363 family protein [Clostridia bacterium]